MSSPTADVFRSGLQFQLSPDSKQLGSYMEDVTYDSLDGSSTELTDVFEEDCIEDDVWSPPDTELKQKIAAQLVNYLSNESLSEDAFLLKHVQRNKLGYVSVKLLTSFKKIRELTRDWRTTLAAAHATRLLEVNEEGTKVRRKDPVPDWLLSVPTSKLLLAWNLLGEEESLGLMETAMRLFSCYGTITSLRILRPGKEIPAELKRYAKKHTELGCKVCAVVEYDYLEGARRAYKALHAEEQLQGNRAVRVALLGSRGVRKPGCSQDHTEEESEDSGKCVGLRKSNRKARHYTGYSLEDSALYSSSESDFAPASPRPNRRVTRSQALYGSPLAIPLASPFRSDPYKNPVCSPVRSPLQPRKLFPGGHTPSPLAAPEFSSSPVTSTHGTFGSRSKCSGDFTQDSLGFVASPWVQRRKTAAQTFFPDKGGPLLPGLPKRPPGMVEVLRQPLGPDGTKGFYNCIGRGKLVLQQ
ncbi:la-related protein 6b isoform X1 [Esox lucius]|uniref:HTH La-type RNA-binding domain-containing protein n=1 Tax=Esox lucius TaxID=8010 RepID=A0A6Q2X7W5_ESOLU|nr:la-related protein 6b isoform X1 [Esox lucius]XP_010869847.2 la-related protein 6b isoform X1 [Esox lucius]